jgi:hypothetical protein
LTLIDEVSTVSRMGRRNAFGQPWDPPDRGEAVRQYLRRSEYKVQLAEYHLGEFERLESELSGWAFFDFEGRPFIPVQAHADATLIQLAAAFDAFACAAAHRSGLKHPDLADFDRSNEPLVKAGPPELSSALRAVKAAPEFAGLGLYRNLAAHRGVIGEKVRGTQGPDGRDEVRLLLPVWLPEEFPDYPEAHVGPILHRYLDWGGEALAYLRRTARAVWGVEDSDGEGPPEGDEGDEGNEGGEGVSTVLFEGGDVTITSSTNVEVATPEALAPQFGDWRAWFSWGSNNFRTGQTDPPAWFVRHPEGSLRRLDAVEIEVEGLRDWLQAAAGDEVAKAVLRYYRPRFEYGTAFGRLLIPSYHS